MNVEVRRELSPPGVFSAIVRRNKGWQGVYGIRPLL
jgi:hypothetical protein